MNQPVVLTDEAVRVGMHVRVRPFYHVPSGRSSLTPARSPFTFEARVQEEFGEMFLVEITWDNDLTPWRKVQAFWAKELHSNVCKCEACKGDGIYELRGA